MSNAKTIPFAFRIPASVCGTISQQWAAAVAADEKSEAKWALKVAANGVDADGADADEARCLGARIRNTFKAFDAGHKNYGIACTFADGPCHLALLNALTA